MNLKPERDDLRCDKLNLRPERPELRPERSGRAYFRPWTPDLEIIVEGLSLACFSGSGICASVD